MKDIILKELTLQDWKAQNRHVVFGDSENKVSGRNKSGKSSLMKAFFWLLSGYSDSETNPNQDLFDNTREITPETPKASVTAVVSIDRETYKLKRTAEASFTRKRGTNEMVKSPSDSYTYEIDDIARTKADWQAWLEENIAPEDMLKFVLSGDFFINMCFEDKKRARSLIEKLVGTVERSEMTGDYSCIEELLKKFSLDEIDTRAANLIKGIDQRLNEIPALISQKEAEISEIEQTDFKAVERDIADLEGERDALDKRMTDLTERIRPQMEAKHEAERAKQMKVEVYEKAYQDWRQWYAMKQNQIVSEINAIRKQNERSKTLYDEAVKKRDEAEARQKRAIERYEELLAKRLRLLKERDEEKAREFDPTTAICPFCGHQLEGDKLQEQADKFEQRKRERIAQTVNEGKSVAAELKRLKAEIQELHKTVTSPLPEVINQPTDELEKIVIAITETDTSKEKFNVTEQAQTLLADIEAVAIPEVTMPDNTEIVEAKKRVNASLVPLYERRGLKSRLQSLREAVDGLRTEQKEKGAEMAEYERQRKAVKDYKQEQMEILSRKVNDGLRFSRLDVWSQQKSGETVPDLVIKNKDGVSFATANNASRLVTTIDIQRLFCGRLGVNMPIFLDEASVIDSENIPHYDNTQMFLLFRADTSLVIESK